MTYVREGNNDWLSASDVITDKLFLNLYGDNSFLDALAQTRAYGFFLFLVCIHDAIIHHEVDRFSQNASGLTWSQLVYFIRM